MSSPAIQIVPATAADVPELTRIALAAKSHWGYPPHWIEQWRDELTISPAYLATHPTFVAKVDGTIAGFGALRLEGDTAWLDHLWVLPTAMHRGIGRALFAHAETTARRAGAQRLRIVGDPHASGFYERMGATLYDRQAAPMDGQERYLPMFEARL